MIVLGLDVSTSVTAYTLMDTDKPLRNSLIKFEGIHLSKIKNIYEKAEAVRDHLEKIKNDYNVDVVYVEEALQTFRRGLSSAKTLSTLMRFNGIVCYILNKTFQVPVNLVNVIHARSSLGIKINRKIEATVKEQVLEWVKIQNEFKEISWPTKTMKSGPRKGQTVEDKSCYDIADACVISLYGIRSLNITS
tara:strand:+ start:787 stop:1359 length:573 start_codon:yes stop_codon:yes gene_type:complete